MTLPRLAAMEDYWRSNPPVHQLVAAYMGYKKPEKREAQQDMGELAGMMGGVSEVPEWLKTMK